MLKLYFYFLQFFLKIHTFGKSDIDRKIWGLTKTNRIYNFFFAILGPCQDFLQKQSFSFVKIRNACIVYLLNFKTRFSTLLKYFLWPVKQPSESPFNEFFESAFAYFDLLFLHLGFCKSY